MKTIRLTEDQVDTLLALVAGEAHDSEKLSKGGKRCSFLCRRRGDLEKAKKFEADAREYQAKARHLWGIWDELSGGRFDDVIDSERIPF